MRSSNGCAVRIHLSCWVILGIFTLVAVDGVAKDSDTTNEVSEEKAVKPPIGLSGIELEELEEDYIPDKKRLIIPPYYQEKSSRLKLRLLFPLFIQRERLGEDAQKELGIFPFYWRHRATDEATDVVFPFYGRFRGVGYKTDFVLQTYYNRSDHGYNLGFAPLFFVGKNTRDRTTYQVVSPLFWRFTKDDSSFLLALIYYQKKNGQDYRLGLPPLLFAGKEKYKSHLVVLPPLFWRFKNEVSYTTKNIFPPFFFNTREQGWSFGAMPLFYLARNKTWDKTLILPFYYSSRWPLLDKQGESLGEGRTFVLPILLSYYRRAPGLSQGGSAIFYHWYWKEGEYLKMFSPFVWMYGNDRTDDNRFLVPPFFYQRRSPIQDDLMVSLIYWDFHQRYKERTVAVMPFFAHNWNLYERHWRTWVLPTFDFGVHPGGYHARFHPLFYRGKDRDADHLVVAPVFFKFKDEEDDDLVIFPFYWSFKDLLHDDSTRVVFPLWWQFDDPRRKNFARVAFPVFWDIRRGKKQSRITLGLPFYWQYRDTYKKTTGIFNFFLNKGEIKGYRFWTFNIAPLLAFGHPPSAEGAYWSFLSGLVGWRRQGRTKQLKLFWIPINFKP